MAEPNPTNVPDDADVRLHGLEFAVEESVPQLVGALVHFLARRGTIALADFEADLRGQFDPDPRMEDSTGAMYARLADLIALYRRDAVEQG